MIFSEIEKFPQEKMYVHTNSNFFLTGEQILYKMYCFNNTSNELSTLSKIGYIELIDSNNKSIYKQKVTLKNGEGTGDVFLNSSLKSGTYKLISYTQWMRNTQTFFEETIFIINPFSEKIMPSDSLKKNDFKSFKTTTTNLVSINLNKKEYAKREKVVLGVQNLISRNLSISVRKKEANFLASKNNIVQFFNEQNKSNARSQGNYLPELRGALFHGKVTSKKVANIENLKIGVSFIGNPKITKIATTNKKGEFYFTVNKPYQAENVILEILKTNKEDYELSLMEETELEKKFKDFTQLFLTEDLRILIKERSLQTQIENAYNQVKNATFYKTNQNKFIFDEHVNKVIYNLDDYTRFKTVKEIAIEILQDVWITEKDQEYAFHMRDINLEYDKDLETLLIVDGFIVQNHGDFIFYDALKIKSIEVVQEKYYFGAKVYQGIINISTFNDVYEPNVHSNNKFSLLKPIPQKKYFFPEYDSVKNDRIPDMRTQLYWNANIKNTTKEILFYTSDISGTFEIILEGVTTTGKPIFERTSFSVK
ncbi:hypothetical protein K8354_09920 [Polaribacter litorisediminis]|uniref:hypothetical protein n=1 Tax=Polaribacter litorisediminis TaxID=1908341 RepID=UPI001CC0BF29|nr:hypothetical protein [Polaribacter litorisediminis]UAM96657.1 hypothetical protein K8354_09920 [Polaribacter litorisediminis]